MIKTGFGVGAYFLSPIPGQANQVFQSHYKFHGELRTFLINFDIQASLEIRVQNDKYEASLKGCRLIEKDTEENAQKYVYSHKVSGNVDEHFMPKAVTIKRKWQLPLGFFRRDDSSTINFDYDGTNLAKIKGKIHFHNPYDDMHSMCEFKSYEKEVTQKKFANSTDFLTAIVESMLKLKREGNLPASVPIVTNYGRFDTAVLKYQDNTVKVIPSSEDLKFKSAGVKLDAEGNPLEILIEGINGIADLGGKKV